MCLVTWPAVWLICLSLTTFCIFRWSFSLLLSYHLLNLLFVRLVLPPVWATDLCVHLSATVHLSVRLSVCLSVYRLVDCLFVSLLFLFCCVCPSLLCWNCPVNFNVLSNVGKLVNTNPFHFERLFFRNISTTLDKIRTTSFLKLEDLIWNLFCLSYGNLFLLEEQFPCFLHRWTRLSVHCCLSLIDSFNTQWMLLTDTSSRWNPYLRADDHFVTNRLDLTLQCLLLRFESGDDVVLWWQFA